MAGGSQASLPKERDRPITESGRSNEGGWNKSPSPRSCVPKDDRQERDATVGFTE